MHFSARLLNKLLNCQGYCTDFITSAYLHIHKQNSYHGKRQYKHMINGDQNLINSNKIPKIHNTHSNFHIQLRSSIIPILYIWNVTILL